MGNIELLQHFKKLSLITLLVLVLSIVLPFYNLPTWPATMVFSFFIARFSLKLQAKLNPEIEFSWKAIFSMVYGDKKNGFTASKCSTKINRYFNNLKSEDPTIYYANAITRLARSLPEETIESIKRARLRYAGIVGSSTTTSKASGIMRDRSLFPELVRSRNKDKSLFSEECVEFCRQVTNTPELLVRIVILDNKFAHYEPNTPVSEDSKIEDVKSLRDHVNDETTLSAINYLNKQSA